jgi:hypothetical protein
MRQGTGFAEAHNGSEGPDGIKTRFQPVFESYKLGFKRYKPGFKRYKLGFKRYKPGIKRYKLGFKRYKLGFIKI